MAGTGIIFSKIGEGMADIGKMWMNAELQNQRDAKLEQIRMAAEDRRNAREDARLKITDAREAKRDKATALFRQTQLEGQQEAARLTAQHRAKQLEGEQEATRLTAEFRTKQLEQDKASNYEIFDKADGTKVRMNKLTGEVTPITEDTQVQTPGMVDLQTKDNLTDTEVEGLIDMGEGVTTEQTPIQFANNRKWTDAQKNEAKVKAAKLAATNKSILEIEKRIADAGTNMNSADEISKWKTELRGLKSLRNTLEGGTTGQYNLGDLANLGKGTSTEVDTTEAETVTEEAPKTTEAEQTKDVRQTEYWKDVDKISDRLDNTLELWKGDSKNKNALKAVEDYETQLNEMLSINKRYGAKQIPGGTMYDIEKMLKKIKKFKSK